jgi:NAD(P)-dependent dehydrogenase (short-subunit alcohol dehydrogenase family)
VSGPLALQEQVAWVTGASAGIGRATVACLVERGAVVVASARDVAALGGLARELGPSVHARPVDVTDARAVADLAADVEAELGPIDMLVNDAGTMDPVGAFAQTALIDWERGLATNLLGAVYTTRAVLPGMVERGRGAIVNVSSGAARHAVPNLSAYSVAKAGLDQLTRSIAAEVKARGVRVNGLYPGLADTGMQARARAMSVAVAGEVLHEAVHAYEARGLLRSPVRAAWAICWLVGPWSGGRTGEVVDLEAAGMWERVRRDLG